MILLVSILTLVNLSACVSIYNKNQDKECDNVLYNWVFLILNSANQKSSVILVWADYFIKSKFWSIFI